MTTLRPFPVLLCALFASCSVESDETADPEDGSFSGPKADGFCAEEGSPEAEGILALVNDAKTTAAELDRATKDGGAGLDRRAAENIVKARPFATLAELDEVPFVGVNTCGALLHHACDVQGRCTGGVGTCDPDAFEARPQRTEYDSTCEAVLLALVSSSPTENADTSVTDATARCAELGPAERQAFDWVATAFDTPVAEFSDAFGEFSVVRVGLADDDVGLVHVVEEDNFTPFHVVFAGEALAAIWTTDGLSAGVDWFCGGTGQPADAPDEFCLGALTDDAALCDAATATHETITRTVADARAEPETLVNAAIVEHAREHDLADAASIEADVASCSESVVIAALTTTGVPVQTYRVVDSTRGSGITVLTRTNAAGDTTIVCGHPE